MENTRNADNAQKELRWVSICDGGEAIIDELLTVNISDIDNKLVILPRSRMVQGAKLRLAEKGGGFTGMIMTKNDLPRHLYDRLKGPRPVIDGSTREHILRGIMTGMELRSLVRAGEVRPGMVRTVSMTIGELLSEGITPQGVKTSARNGRSRELSDIFDRYMNELEERNLVDSDMLASEAATLIDSSDLRYSALGIYLPGKLTRSVQDLLSQLVSRTDRVVVMEYASREAPSLSDIPEVCSRPSFSPGIPLPGTKALSRLGSEKTYRSISGMDPVDETRKIFRDIKRRSELEGIIPSEIGIVLPSKRSRDDIIRTVSEEYGIPVDQGEDIPLEMVPVISTIMNLLSIPEDGFRRRKVVESLSSPFIRLEDSSGDRLDGHQLELLTRIAAMAPTRRDLKFGWDHPLKGLEKDQAISEDIRSLAMRYRPPLLAMLQKLESISKARATVKDHLDAISDLLAGLKVPLELQRVMEQGEIANGVGTDEGPYHLNLTAHQKFLSILRSIERRSRVLAQGRITFDELLDSIRLVVSTERIRSSSRVAGVQVMGLEEAAGSAFGTVYISDLVEGSIPSTEGAFRILTDAERGSIGLPVAIERREKLELLAMTIGSSSEPVICFHRNQGDRPVLPSSFIEDLPLEAIDTGRDPRSILELHRMIGELIDPACRNCGVYDLTLPDLITNTRADAERIRRGISSYRKRKQSDPNEHSGRIVEEELLMDIRDRFGPKHIWSVTQFETFRKCPYRFLIRYLLGLEELEDLEPGIPPEKKGLIFHEVAEKFYDRFRIEHGRRVTESNLGPARSLIGKITKEVMGRYTNSGPYWDALQDQLLGTDGEKGLLDCFLDVEAKYQGNFLVEGTEIRFGLLEADLPAVAISLPGEEDDNDRFKLRGSIDRMDVLSTREGDLDFIWDYKTGAMNVDKDSVQVHLYLAALRRLFPEHYPAGGGYYYVRRRGSIERAPVHGSDVWDGAVLDKETLQRHIEELGSEVHSTIERCLEMIDSIRGGDLAVQSNCRDDFCSFNHICRRGDL